MFVEKVGTATPWTSRTPNSVIPRTQSTVKTTTTDRWILLHGMFAHLPSSTGSGSYGIIPQPFFLHKSILALSLNGSQILYVSIPMNRFQKIQFLTGFELPTQPTAFNIFLLSAFSDLTEGRTSTSSTTFSAAKLHHCTKDFVTFLIVFEVFTKRKRGDEFSESFVS